MTRKPLIITAAVIAAVVVLGWLIAFSPVLGASQVTVRGTHSLTAQEVRQAARVPHGTPLVRLDTAAVARRVDALPDVASARVSVSYPSSVVITVSERTPVGYIAAGGKTVLVDRTGRQYRVVATPPAGLPRFDVPAGQQSAGGQGADEQAAGAAAATVAAALPKAILTQLSVIQASTPTAITLQLRDGRTVRWGSAERSADKARLLPTLLKQPGTVFDLSDPDLVVAR